MRESSSPVAVICAIEEEMAHLRRLLPPGREERRANRSAWLTELDGLPILLAVCGMGMLSAAAVTESIIGQWAPSAILNYGCTGAHRPELLPGDMVIGTQVVAYDNIREQPDGAQKFVGMHYVRCGEIHRTMALSADPALLKLAVRAMDRLDGAHEPWPTDLAWPASVAHRLPQVMLGTVGSADRWNRTPASIAALVALHGTHCEDMEAGAIALTCASHDVPFLSVKDISNNELYAKTESGPAFLEQFGPQLGKRAAALTLAMLHDLAASH